MEDWLYYFLSIAFCLALSLLLFPLRPRPATTTTPPLPSGPTALTSAALGPLLLLAWTSVNIESVVRVARSWYGPVFTVHLLPSLPVIFVTDRDVAHRILVRRGAAFADRPPANLTTRIFSSDQSNITTAMYGPLWRALRRNLTGKILHPSSVLRYAAARRAAAEGLIAGVKQQMTMRGGDGVIVVEALLHRAVFHVMAVMCFGKGIGDGDVASVMELQREFLTSAVGFQVFGAWPAVTKLVFRRRFKRMLSIRRRQEELFIPLIQRRRRRHAGVENTETDCYVDSLLGLRIPVDDGGNGGCRELTEKEMVGLCTEFLSAPVDSTATAMQWTMANLVAQPEIQAKLRDEIRHVAGGTGGGASSMSIQEEHLQKMPFLRAVVLEGLRRHPPGRFMVPHTATDEHGGAAAVSGFGMPKQALLNFTLGFMAMDGTVWREPERFRPERFLPGGEGEDVDLTGGKEIKMMPFGAGRRVCPGIDVSLLHLEWFVATMVSEFEWTEVPGEVVDFADKLELTMVMRRPLRARVVPCF